MIFVDASALIAIVAEEPEGISFAETLNADPVRLCSAVSIWETVAGLCRSHAFSVASAHKRVRLFLEALELRLVPIGEAELDAAIEAYAEFGEGRHPAALNMGDCYAYACAKTARAKLLFKGDDFTKTDIIPAR